MGGFFVQPIRSIHGPAANQIHPQCFKLAFENTCAVSFRSGSNACFWIEQNGCSFWWTRDTEEASLQAGAIPNNTKATTDWGIRIWNE